MPTDEWLYADEAAEVCGITPAAWRRATTSTPTRKASVRVERGEYRRNRRNGRPQWLRRCVERYRDRGDVSQSANTHRAIRRAVSASRPTTLRMEDIAEMTGFHVRTVKRHLSGECLCPADVA